MNKTQVNLIEELAANAWRPEIEQSLDGWRLRFNQGVNRRCNSVWPNQLVGSLDLAERLDMVEQFYLRWKIRPRYQICPAAIPEDLADILSKRGYTEDAHTAVQTASIDQVLSETDSNPDFDIELENGLSEEWFKFHCDLEGLSGLSAQMRKGTLSRIGPQKAFVTLRIENNRAAIGLGVVERGWVGIFCMASHPEFKCRGAAISVLSALGIWGKNQGAENMYLQVMENNSPALSLYKKVGFETLYKYYYAEGPENY